MDRVRDIILAYDPEYTGGSGVSGGDPYYQDFTDKLDAFVREYPPASGGGASIAEYDFASSSSGDEGIPLPKRGGDARGVGAGLAASIASPFEELAVAGLMTTTPAPFLAAPTLAAPTLAAPTLAAPTLAAPTLAAPALAAGVTLAATVPTEGISFAAPLAEGFLI